MPTSPRPPSLAARKHGERLHRRFTEDDGLVRGGDSRVRDAFLADTPRLLDETEAARILGGGTDLAEKLRKSFRLCPNGNHQDDADAVAAVVDAEVAEARDGARRERRRLRYKRRAASWAMGPNPAWAKENEGEAREKYGRFQLDRLRKCGKVCYTAGGVDVHVGEGGRSYLSGLVSCSSVWACPVCSAAIRNHRSQEINGVVLAHRANGGGVLFLTLTVRHNAGQDLATVWAASHSRWRAMLQHRAYRTAAEKFGVTGFISTTEATWGAASGWHPHLHVILLTEKPVSPRAADPNQLSIDELEALTVEPDVDPDEAAASNEQEETPADLTVPRARPEPWADPLGTLRWDIAHVWRDLVRADHPDCEPTLTAGCTLYEVTTADESTQLAEYVAKYQDHEGRPHAIGLEMARIDLKSGGEQRYMPFELLDLAGQELEAGEPGRFVGLWREWETVTKGQRCFTFSRNLKELRRVALDLAALGDLTDEEILEMSPGDDAVANIPAADWTMVVHRQAIIPLLDGVEHGGATWLRRFLSDLQAGVVVHECGLPPP